MFGSSLLVLGAHVLIGFRFVMCVGDLGYFGIQEMFHVYCRVQLVLDINDSAQTSDGGRGQSTCRNSGSKTWLSRTPT